MAPRLQLEKAAWRWTETVPPEAVTQEHIEAAYRIGLEPCQRGACRLVHGPAGSRPGGRGLLPACLPSLQKLGASPASWNGGGAGQGSPQVPSCGRGWGRGGAKQVSKSCQRGGGAPWVSWQTSPPPLPIGAFGSFPFSLMVANL